jgi:hypothetical protein
VATAAVLAIPKMVDFRAVKSGYCGGIGRVAAAAFRPSRCVMMMRHVAIVLAGLVGLSVKTPAFALDLNSYRAEHGRPPLHTSAALAGAAYSHARSLAARHRLDHDGFRQRVPITSGTAAENVAFGCGTEDCVIRMWARSGGHRANMLRRDVTSYGLAFADGSDGRRYWVLELGN